MAGAIAQDRQSCQFSFVLDEKSTVVPVRLAGEQSGGKRKVSYGDARSNSERAAPSACVGRQFWLLRSFGIDRLRGILGDFGVEAHRAAEGLPDRIRLAGQEGEVLSLDESRRAPAALVAVRSGVATNEIFTA